MATSEFCTSIPHTFPQPCRPFHAHDSRVESTKDENEKECATNDHQVYYPVYESEEENYMSADDGEEHDEQGDSPKILRRFRDKLDETGHIVYKKLHFKFGETLHDFKERVVSDLFEKSSRSDSEASNDHKNYTERGIDIGMEDPKLERFKVKAVNVVGVGVVKEENH